MLPERQILELCSPDDRTGRYGFAAMSLLRYVTHPNVEIDPHVAVTDWSLSDVGRRRVKAMLRNPWIADIGQLVSSGETKARETAAMLAESAGLAVEVRPNTGETDRSATGFVPHERHEQLADRFFAAPADSAEGWETANAAQRRIVDAVADLLVDAAHDTVIVGHGAVGTLLMLHLTGEPIDRAHDQPGQGHYWTLDRTSGLLLHRWRAVEGDGP